jgi:hypothetical protein
VAEDRPDVDPLAGELKTLVGHGVTLGKATNNLPRLRAVLGVPNDTPPSAAVRTIKRLLRTRLHTLSGDHVVFSGDPSPIPAERLKVASECLFHLTEPQELRDARYAGMPQYDRRRLYAMDKLQVRFPPRTWREPGGPEHELMTTLARALLEGKSGHEVLRGSIDQEEADYFLDDHGCIVSSEHKLTITALSEGWAKLGPLVRLWRDWPGPVTVEDALASKPTVVPAGTAAPIGGTSISTPILGASGDVHIGLAGKDKAALTIGLPRIDLHKPHRVAWKMYYSCRGAEAAGKIERAEVVYTVPVTLCVLRIWPTEGIKPIPFVRHYNRLVPAGDLRLREIGLGEQSNHLEPEADGSYRAEFHNLEPLRYYGLEWWWRGPFE